MVQISLVCMLLLMQSGKTPSGRPIDGVRRVSDTSCQPFTAPQESNPPSKITGVWANDGGDKVTQDELRSTNCVENLTGSIINRTWNGATIQLYGARNEMVSFNLVLEAKHAPAKNVSVTFDTLTSSDQTSTIRSIPAATKDGVFSWVDRPIELFYTRYLQIKGLSTFGYNARIDQQVPIRLQASTTRWKDRPDHDKFYPDILVPLELTPSFMIEQGANQSIWADIYIPKSAPPGLYTGTVQVSEEGVVTRSVPVSLQVYGFSLPDQPSAKAMVVYQASAINASYYGSTYVQPESLPAPIRDKYFQLAHRHRIALIGDSGSCSIGDYVCPEDVARLDGSTFTAAKGYDGPGAGVGQDVWSIGTYQTWHWRNGITSASMRQHSDAWVKWFSEHLPTTDYFLYLWDEPAPKDLKTVEQWAGWVKNNPGIGSRLKTFSTVRLPEARTSIPSLTIAAQFADFVDVHDTAGVAAAYRESQSLYAYNGTRPAVGSFTIEDDGIALRQLAWAQHKLGVNRWMYWMLNGSTSFTNANTWGQIYLPGDPSLGDFGGTNGEATLVYPGTTSADKANSYGVNAPFASVRLKAWRRGIQDVDYITMAAAIDPEGVKALVNQMVPKALWEVGAADQNDPTWVVAGITWPVDPDVWEAARAQLAAIIDGTAGGKSVRTSKRPR